MRVPEIRFCANACGGCCLELQARGKGKADVLQALAGHGSSPNAPHLLSHQIQRAFHFSAIHEQLRLKLDSTKGPVEILVIDHLEKPTQNWALLRREVPNGWVFGSSEPFLAFGS